MIDQLAAAAACTYCFISYTHHLLYVRYVDRDVENGVIKLWSLLHLHSFLSLCRDKFVGQICISRVLHSVPTMPSGCDGTERFGAVCSAELYIQYHPSVMGDTTQLQDHVPYAFQLKISGQLDYPPTVG